MSTLTLEDEETCFDEENELGGNDQLLECLVDDFPYIPPQDQDPYFYVNDGDDVWFMFFFVKTFYFHNILVFYLSWITLRL